MNKIKEYLKTPYFWCILLLLLFGFLIFTIVNKNSIKQGYLIIDNVDAFTCFSNQECKRVEQEKITDENKLLLDVYRENKLLGKYKMDYVNKWNFFDEKNNWVNSITDFIAVSEELSFKSLEYDLRPMNEEEINILQAVLKEKNISYYTELDQNEVLEYDFNKDGKKEKLIFANNATEESTDEKLFSIVITMINNKRSVLFLDIYNQYENFEVPIYYVKGIVNLFEQKEDYLMIQKGFFSEVGKPEIYLYKLEKELTSLIKKN